MVLSTTDRDSIFCEMRKPGKVLRVISAVWCLSLRVVAHKPLFLVATADRVYTNLSAGRSTVNRLRAEPANFKKASLGSNMVAIIF